MKDETKTEIIEHAEREMPRECCGVILNYRGHERYFPCRNIALKNDQFRIHWEDYDEARKQGDITAIVHSHVYCQPTPSQADIVACEKTKLPWHIVSVPNRTWGHVEPTGYIAPYVGREWKHGVLDCYTLVQDYYRREMGLVLPDVPRQDEWWKRGLNLYGVMFEKVGFRRIDFKDIRPGDGFLMSCGADVPNHAAIYIGKTEISPHTILHHFYGRLSTRDGYGGYWTKNTTHILRYHGPDNPSR